jgi:putative FmdB family regulatory protein
MPTYEYACPDCGHEFEQFQPITAKPLRKCPQCGRRRLRRLVGSGAGIIFKGSGFYATDYRSESYKKAAEAEKKPAPGGAAEGEKGKTDGEAKSDRKGGKAGGAEADKRKVG